MLERNKSITPPRIRKDRGKLGFLVSTISPEKYWTLGTPRAYSN